MLITPLKLPIGAAGSGIVSHQAWRNARAALLEAASAGPATFALLGEAGTGKSWLLRHVESILRRHGHAVTLLRQGELPWQLIPGTILLIDEASRLDVESLAELAAQQTTVVILADLPTFGKVLAQCSPPPRIIRLLPLAADQVADFVAHWLQFAGREPDAVTADGLERLALHVGGTPRLIAHLLNAALAFGPHGGPVTGAHVDEVATLRLDGGAAAPGPATVERETQPCPPDAIVSRPVRHSRARRAIAAASLATLAAAALLAFRVAERPRQVTISRAAVPAPPPATPAPLALAISVTPEPVRADALLLAGSAAPPALATPIALADPATPEPARTQPPAVVTIEQPPVAPVPEAAREEQLEHDLTKPSPAGGRGLGEGGSASGNVGSS